MCLVYIMIGDRSIFAVVLRYVGYGRRQARKLLEGGFRNETVDRVALLLCVVELSSMGRVYVPNRAVCEAIGVRISNPQDAETNM